VKRRILLDENVPHDLRHHLGQHETMTVAYAGFAGYKNGQLLDAAEAAGFDVLVTVIERCIMNRTCRAVR
jgi:hypothetical protein